MAEIDRAKVLADIAWSRGRIDELQAEAERHHEILRALAEQQQQEKMALVASERLLGSLTE